MPGLQRRSRLTTRWSPGSTPGSSTDPPEEHRGPSAGQLRRNGSKIDSKSWPGGPPQACFANLGAARPTGRAMVTPLAIQSPPRRPPPWQPWVRWPSSRRLHCFRPAGRPPRGTAQTPFPHKPLLATFGRDRPDHRCDLRRRQRHLARLRSRQRLLSCRRRIPSAGPQHPSPFPGGGAGSAAGIRPARPAGRLADGLS
jgi:hypothetical protein